MSHIDHARQEAMTALARLRDAIAFTPDSPYAALASFIRSEIAGMSGKLEALSGMIDLLEAQPSPAKPDIKPPVPVFRGEVTDALLRRLRGALSARWHDERKAELKNRLGGILQELRVRPDRANVVAAMMELNDDEREFVLEGEIID